jgi:transposase InsO family protein
VIGSVSRSSRCLDNALAERFFATLKSEFTAMQRWPTRAAARTAIFAWIDVFYNCQRCHSTLAYRPPAACEAELLLPDRAA